MIEKRKPQITKQQAFIECVHWPLFEADETDLYQIFNWLISSAARQIVVTRYTLSNKAWSTHEK